MIPARNARRHLERTLPAILAAASRHGGVEVILADNGSGDGTAEWVAGRFGSEVLLVASPGVRVGAVRNAGSAHACGAILSFIDADCLVGPEYFIAVDRALADAALTAVGAPYDLPESPSRIERAWQDLHPIPSDGPAEWLFGGNCAVRAEALRDIGGWDSTLESGEDAELGLRLRRRGWRLAHGRAVRAQHLGNPKTLATFFRTQVWHGMGMFGTVARDSLDKPTLMLAAFLLAHAAAVALVLLTGGTDWRAWLAAGALLLLAPGLAVLYRLATGGRTTAPITALTLYYIYFAARTTALVRLFGRRLGLGRGARQLT